MKALNAITVSGKEVLPLVEGGKGIAVSTGESSGAWAAAGGVGTFSGVNADSYDEKGALMLQEYKGKTRKERHEELVGFAIKGGLAQAQRTHELANGNGRIHVNVLWEMGGAERILHGILSQAKGIIHGITCGAGMPYKVSEIAAQYNVFYYPIVSSVRAFRALWLRSFKKVSELLGGVVYEDPWLAGGHNGLSNSEDPTKPEKPYSRVLALRQFMREIGLGNIPIIMAGGVWWLSEWEEWIDNKELGPICFQFGTRPLLTKESPISDAWKKRLMTLKKGDVFLNRFSPTGFYSSAVRNEFLQELKERAERQIAYSTEKTEDNTVEFRAGAVGKPVYISQEGAEKAKVWNEAGFTKAMRTPDSTLIFVTAERARKIADDQARCMGCLSACAFSNWAQNEEGTTGRMADPRSFCIQKTLQDISHENSVEDQLMFAGHNAYRFSEDPFYGNGFVPSVKELVERIQTGY